MGCYSIERLVAPSSMINIDDKAFYACKKLESAQFLAENVAILRYGLFNGKCFIHSCDTSFFETPAECKVVEKAVTEIENFEGFGGQVFYIIKK